jgi:hypothetical protein
MSLTLRVEKNMKSGNISPDWHHPNGGQDVENVYAFRHLFPKGYADFMEQEIFLMLVNAHGWKLEVKYIDDVPQGMTDDEIRKVSEGMTL